MGYENDKYKKKFVSWHCEERHTSDMFVCLGNLLSLFLRSYLAASVKLYLGLLKGPITMVGNAEKQVNSVFCTFLQESYSQQEY